MYYILFNNNLLFFFFKKNYLYIFNKNVINFHFLHITIINKLLKQKINHLNLLRIIMYCLNIIYLFYLFYLFYLIKYWVCLKKEVKLLFLIISMIIIPF